MVISVKEKYKAGKGLRKCANVTEGAREGLTETPVSRELRLRGGAWRKSTPVEAQQFPSEQWVRCRGSWKGSHVAGVSRGAWRGQEGSKRDDGAGQQSPVLRPF